MFTLIFKSFVFANNASRRKNTTTLNFAMFSKETCRVNLVRMIIIYTAIGTRLEQESAVFRRWTAGHRWLSERVGWLWKHVEVSRRRSWQLVPASSYLLKVNQSKLFFYLRSCSRNAFLWKCLGMKSYIFLFTSILLNVIWHRASRTRQLHLHQFIKRLYMRPWKSDTPLSITKIFYSRINLW